MYFRITRLRFVFIRCCFFFLIFVFLFQFRTFFLDDDNISLNENPFYWQALRHDERLLTKEQRIIEIQLVEKQREQSQLNWTKIFSELYQRKTDKLSRRDENNVYKSRRIIHTKNISQETIEIFEETPVFQRPKFCSSTQIFHPECPYQNCQWSCKKSSRNREHLRRANIFHHVDINHDDMQEKIKSRSKTDIWILWIDEANRQLENLNQYQFNWTISFRQDSEISIGTYGLLIPLPPSNILHSINQSDLILSSDVLHLLTKHNIPITDSLLENQIFTNYRYRSKHALWFVSNCDPQNRLRYYQQLKTAFPIHAFGSCVSDTDNPCKKNDPCEFDQSRLALFYLAFESQTCQDYITEKFWRALYYGMIPVVFGPAKQSYLDLGIPESAFIHTDDFQSTKQLATYLHEITNDYRLYRKYFQWINQYEIVYQTADLEAIRMCELCMRLNRHEKNEYRFYKDIHRWHRTGC